VNPSVPPPGFVPPPDGGGVSEPVSEPAPTVAPAQRPLPRKLIASGVGLLAAAAAVFVAFGSSSNPAVDPVAQAATDSAGAPGYRMNLSIEITSPQLGVPLSTTGSAVVDPPDHALSMSLAIDMSQVPGAAQALGSSTMETDTVLDGQDVYVKFPQVVVDHLSSLGGKPWIEVNAAEEGGLPGLSSLGDDPNASDPSQMLQELRAAGDSVVNEGPQEIDGVQTTHYQSDLSPDSVLAKVPSAGRALLQRMVQGEIPVDVWIDAHHLVRRMTMFLALSVPDGPSLQESITADFTDYGPQPRPTPPPASQVTALSSLAGVSVAG
jgi:hypothetical protein